MDIRALVDAKAGIKKTKDCDEPGHSMGDIGYHDRQQLLLNDTINKLCLTSLQVVHCTVIVVYDAELNPKSNPVFNCHQINVFF